MRPANLTTKIFLDSGDPRETKAALDLLGFLDGQTTNPSLIAKNPTAQERLKVGELFGREEIDAFYKTVVTDVSALIPAGSVSIEVYADAHTSADEMLSQAREMNPWIQNAHIKFPTNTQGLEAAEKAVAEGMRVNMTLVFTQAQAAAVHAATRGAERGAVYLSPFVGRLDDKGVHGMDLVKNIVTMYHSSPNGEASHVEVLTASARSLDHFFTAIKVGSDIITAPFGILKEWAEKGMPLPDEQFKYERPDLAPIAYESLDMNLDWRTFPLDHELLTRGIDRFAKDWNSLMR